MEYVKVLWIAVFFLFSLCLVFIWSKILVVFKRTAVIADLLKSCEVVSATKKPD